MNHVEKIWSVIGNIWGQCIKQICRLMDFIYQNREFIKEFIKQNILAICLGLSLCSIVILLHLNANLGALIKMQNQLIKAQEEHIKTQDDVIQDVIKTKNEMQKIRPRTKQNILWREACVFVGKCRAFEIPLKIALISARAETEFRMNARGSCGEWGTHQAMYFTMRRFFPRADATKLIYWEVASWLHLKECYERSGRELFLTLAYHNAGPNWSRPERAMWAARRHISRCRVIRKEIDLDLKGHNITWGGNRDMKVITLMQPHATLMAINAKKIETRSWGTNYRGQILIHSSARFPRFAKDLCYREPFKSALAKAGYISSEQLPLGKIIAASSILDSLKMTPDRYPSEPELSFGWYAPDRFAWYFGQAKLLPNPILVKGKLGLWEFDWTGDQGATV